MVLLARSGHVMLPEDKPPQLMVVIDTEEEFDWQSGPDRSSTGVTAMAHLDRVQNLFNDYGIKPCYVVDYPVAKQPEGHALLKQYHAAGWCDIGAHLHPWVNPPYDEPLSVSNTYPGNLPPELEREKLRVLRDTLAEVFEFTPRIYKAGRYGLGNNSAKILADLGFDIDLSVCPPVDHSHDGGPDYRNYSAQPFWFGDQSQLEIPVTGAFVGWAGPLSRPLFDWSQKLKRWHAPGVLSRLSMVDRLLLSPEGFTHEEHRRLTNAMLRQGVRTFTWSFHSTSLVPGFTPYVRTEADLDVFLDRFQRYFDYFFGQLGGVATTPAQLKDALEVNS